MVTGVASPALSQWFKGKHWRIATVSVLWLLASPPLSLPTLAQAKTATPSSPVSTSSTSDSFPTDTQYILGPGDKVNVNVFQIAELSGDFLILADGSLSLPLIGTVKAAGLTIEQLRTLLLQRYLAFIKRPVVTLSLTTPRPLRIAVAGEVNSPGSYSLNLEKGDKYPSVTDMISKAGGTTVMADIGQVKILRNYQGKEYVKILNLWELVQKGDLNQDISLRDGDSVLIPTQQNIDIAQTRQLATASFGLAQQQEINIAVIGEVNRPGSYTLRPQQNTTSSVKQRPPLLSLALQTAGGIKPLANLRDIEVRRYIRDGSQQTIKVDLWALLQTGDMDQDLILQQGDTIIVPTGETLDPKESETLAAASFSPGTIKVNIVGEVKKPGMVELPPNTPLNQAMLAAGGFDSRRADTNVVELIRLNPNGTVSKREIQVDFSTGVSDEKNPPLRNNDIVVINPNGLAQTTDTIGAILSPLGSVFGLASFLSILGL
jgi:polysaccharide export outer membrane protein